MAKKKFSKKFQKKFWPKKIGNFFQNLICEKIPCSSQKMMTFRKKYMSGVYENVFEKSEIFVLLSLRDRLLLTICVRIPCTPVWWTCLTEVNVKMFSFAQQDKNKRRLTQLFDLKDTLPPKKSFPTCLCMEFNLYCKYRQWWEDRSVPIYF